MTQNFVNETELRLAEKKFYRKEKTKSYIRSGIVIALIIVYIMIWIWGGSISRELM